MELCRALLCLCSCIYCKNQADRVLFVFPGWRLAPSTETKVGQRWPCFSGGVHKSLEGYVSMTKGCANTHKGHPKEANEHTLPLAILGRRYVKIHTVTSRNRPEHSICAPQNWLETNLSKTLGLFFALFVDFCCTHMQFHKPDMNPNQRGWETQILFFHNQSRPGIIKTENSGVSWTKTTFKTVLQCHHQKLRDFP